MLDWVTRAVSVMLSQSLLPSSSVLHSGGNPCLPPPPLCLSYFFALSSMASPFLQCFLLASPNPPLVWTISSCSGDISIFFKSRKAGLAFLTGGLPMASHQSLAWESWLRCSYGSCLRDPDLLGLGKRGQSYLSWKEQEERVLWVLLWVGKHKRCVYVCMCAKLLQLCLTLSNPMDNSLPHPSVHGALQARILEWVAISYSRRSPPRDRNCISYVSFIGRRVVYHWHHLGSLCVCVHITYWGKTVKTSKWTKKTKRVSSHGKPGIVWHTLLDYRVP